MKSKTGNLHGFEKLGIKGFTSIPAGTDAVLIVRGGRSVLPKVEGVSTVIGIGVFLADETSKMKTVLPGAAFTEKDGTIVNYQGREQRLRRVVTPVGQSKLLSEVLMLWTHSAGAEKGAVI